MASLTMALGLCTVAGCATNDIARHPDQPAPATAAATSLDLRLWPLPRVPIPKPPPIKPPFRDVPIFKPGPILVPPAEVGQVKTVLDDLDNGSAEDKLVREAVCQVLASPPRYQESEESWENRIRAQLPVSLPDSQLSDFAIDYAIGKVTGPLAGLDTYGEAYFRVCGLI